MKKILVLLAYFCAIFTVESVTTTTVYEPTTVYQTVTASETSLSGFFRKTRKIRKHRHEVIKQDKDEFEKEVEDYNLAIDKYRELAPGDAAKHRGTKEPSKDDYEHCKPDDEWCCEYGEEGCDENEYEECNEGEEGCEEYDEDDDNLIIREIDYDIYIIDNEEFFGVSVYTTSSFYQTTIEPSTGTLSGT